MATQCKNRRALVLGRGDVRRGGGVKSDAATGVVFPAATKEKADGQFRAVAAKGEGDSLSVFVVRYAPSNDVTDTGTVVLRVPGRPQEFATEGPDAVEDSAGVGGIAGIVALAKQGKGKEYK